MLPALQAETQSLEEKIDRLEKALGKIQSTQDALLQRLDSLESSVRQAAVPPLFPRPGPLKEPVSAYPIDQVPEVGELLAVKHGNSWWACRVLEVAPENQTKITYLGWEPSWDEYVGRDRMGQCAEVVQVESQLKQNAPIPIPVSGGVSPTPGTPVIRRRVVPTQKGTSGSGSSEAQSDPGVGQEAPPFEIATTEGNTVKLADYRGKYVLLDFWATWCGPCVGETPNLKAVFEQYGKRDDFVMMGLSLDQDKEKPIAYAKEKGTGWIDGFLGDWGKDEVTKKYGVRGIPSIWLIGPDGKVVAKELRGEGILQAVKNALEGKKS